MGFDIDCLGVVYDGSQVYCILCVFQFYLIQINYIDLIWCSFFYENCFFKYFYRGFEVYWLDFDWFCIDLIIFEWSFQCMFGLVRFFVLECFFI